MSKIDVAVENFIGYIRNRIKRGYDNPKVKIVRERSWFLTDNEIIAIGDQAGTDLRAQAILSPEEAIKKGMNEQLVKDLTKRDLVIILNLPEKTK